MATRQYIGARYVTKIYENSVDPSTAEWESGVVYEPLTLVTYNFGSYLSKKQIPGSVGDPASNPEYWVQTGFYNGQISALDARITRLESSYYVFLPTGDTTDRSTELTTVLSTHKAVYFTEGDYYFANSVTLPDDAIITGAGAAAHIIYTGNSTFLTVGDNNEIASLFFDGGLIAKPAARDGAICLYVSQKTNPIKIHDCSFFGFSSCGIEVDNMGWDYLSSIEVENCYFKWNFDGIFLYQYGEYAIISNCHFYQNSNGSLIQGGNNIFNGCEFSRNDIGAFVNGTSILNNSHGALNNCSFNHNGVGVTITNISAGELISGSIFYENTSDDIQVIGSTAGGVVFSGCNFGFTPKIAALNSDVEFKNNTFMINPTIATTNSTLRGVGNTYGNGNSIAALNRNLAYSAAALETVTYESNSICSASDVASGIVVTRDNNILCLRFGLKLSNLTQGGPVKVAEFTLPTGYSVGATFSWQYRDYLNNNYEVTVDNTNSISILVLDVQNTDGWIKFGTSLIIGN